MGMIRRSVIAGLSGWVLSIAAEPAHADADAGHLIATQVCAPCHGPDGNSPSPLFPILAGQTFRYLYLELRDFHDGRRADPLMSPVAQQLSKADMLNVAEYLSAQKAKSIVFNGDPEKVERGRVRAKDTLCTMCHLGDFAGQNEIPKVAGQYPEYIEKQLKAFKARTRTNDAGNMTAVAGTLSDQDIVDLSDYVASLR
jgi:cytochrome c553